MNWSVFAGTFLGTFLGHLVWQILEREDDTEAGSDECHG